RRRGGARLPGGGARGLRHRGALDRREPCARARGRRSRPERPAHASRLMRLVVVAVGRVKERPLRAVLDDYLGRIRRFTPCDEVELAEGKPDKLVEAFGRATGEATTIALEVTGRSLDSEGFAKQLGRASARHKGVVAFLIGGADGLPKGVSDRAH